MKVSFVIRSLLIKMNSAVHIITQIKTYRVLFSAISDPPLFIEEAKADHVLAQSTPSFFKIKCEQWSSYTLQYTRSAGLPYRLKTFHL